MLAYLQELQASWACGTRPDGLVHKLILDPAPTKTLLDTLCGRIIRPVAYWKNGYDGTRRCERCWVRLTGGV